MSKIFVRHRRHQGPGSGRPRFAVVAVQGVDLHLFHTRLRRAELEKIAADVEAEIVYLPRGGRAAEDEGGQGRGEGRGQGEGRGEGKGRRHEHGGGKGRGRRHEAD